RGTSERRPAAVGRWRAIFPWARRCRGVAQLAHPRVEDRRRRLSARRLAEQRGGDAERAAEARTVRRTEAVVPGRRWRRRSTQRPLRTQRRRSTRSSQSPQRCSTRAACGAGRTRRPRTQEIKRLLTISRCLISRVLDLSVAAFRRRVERALAIQRSLWSLCVLC